MSATTSNFIEGGEIDPFGSPTGKPLTLAEQAAMEEARRRRRIEETSRNTANINNRRGGYNEQRGLDNQDAVDASNSRVLKDRLERTGTTAPTRKSFGRALWEDPVTLGVLTGPLAVTGAGLAVGGASALGFGAGSGTIAGGGSAAAPIAVANEATGLATAGPGFSAEAANAYNAAAAGNAAFSAGAASAPAAGAAAGGAGDAFSVGGALKEVAPVLGAVAPMAIDALAGGRTKEESALLHKQEQLAKEAKARMAQVQESRMNALGQQLLAMNPRNQMMAKMYGPGAAFQPQEFAAMTQNPIPPPEMPAELKALEGNTKPLTPQQKAAYAAFAQQKQQYEQGNQQRSDQMMNGMAPPGPGPAPLQARTPQAARKY